MAKYSDKEVGRARPVLAYKPGETWQERHRRRLQFNLAQQELVNNWCELHGIGLAVGNDGHHWRFSYGNKNAEWWPSSAKLVFQKRYQNGIHCHDYAQLMACLRQRWKLPGLEGVEKMR